MSMERKLAAGVDYGSDSVRVLLVEMEYGNAVSEGVCAYPDGRKRNTVILGKYSTANMPWIILKVWKLP